MILSLDIQNYILIEKAHIEFDPHFNVITGETGSGKSMLLSSLLLLSQGKLNDDVIRTGTSFFSVSVTFSLDDLDADVMANLKDYIEDAESLVLTRTKKSGSPSVCSINGITVAQKIVKDTIGNLVYFSSQREQNMLLKSESALNFVDAFSSNKKLRDEVKLCEKELLSIKREIESIKESVLKTEEEKDYLLTVKNEIESANVKIGEDDEIKETLKAVKKSAQYISAINEALLSLSKGETNALSLLSTAERELSHLNDKDEDRPFKDEIATIEDTYQMLSTIADNLQSRLKKINLTESDIDALQERDSLLNRLKRKFGGTLENVIKRLDDINSKLDGLESSDEELQILEDKFNKMLKEYREKKHLLFLNRQKNAAELDKKTILHLRSLEMPSSEFKTEVVEGSDFKDDTARFLFSANEGEKLGDVKEISSGGELSRLFLSLLSASPKFSSSHTIIFDEIDTGLGGNAAIALASYLKELSEFSQILLITHSALIASASDLHIGVKKSERGGRTYSEVSALNSDDRVLEVARLLSGKGTKEAIDLAKSMLQGTRGLF